MPWVSADVLLLVSWGSKIHSCSSLHGPMGSESNCSQCRDTDSIAGQGTSICYGCGHDKKKNSFLFPYNLHAPWRHWWSHMLWWPYLPSLSCHFYVPIILQNAMFQWVLLKTSVESIKKTMPPRAGSPEKTRLGITMSKKPSAILQLEVCTW